MKKLTYWALCFSFIIFAPDVFASENKEIGSVSVLADSHLAPALAEISSEFTHQYMITVSNSFGVSIEQEKRIEDGESADLFITTNESLIQELKIKGLVDVYSIGRIVSNKDGHYIAAVVASENMTSARTFLTFLKSEAARDIFRKNGLSIP